MLVTEYISYYIFYVQEENNIPVALGCFGSVIGILLLLCGSTVRLSGCVYTKLPDCDTLDQAAADGLSAVVRSVREKLNTTVQLQTGVTVADGTLSRGSQSRHRLLEGVVDKEFTQFRQYILTMNINY